MGVKTVYMLRKSAKREWVMQEKGIMREKQEHLGCYREHSERIKMRVGKQ